MNRSASLPAVLAAITAFVVACGGNVTGNAQGIAVAIQPTAPQVQPSGTVRFASAVTGTADTSVVWAVDEAAGGTVTTTGLYTAPSTTGQFHVRVSSHADPSVQAVAVVTVTSAPSVPAAPSNLVAYATSSSGITLTWTNNATDQTGFVVQRSSTSGTTGFAQIATPGASSTSYNDAGLSASTQYWYRVAATNGAGNSAFSGVATATTQSGGSTAVARPSYNTGTGFFTLNGKLYDANGIEFIPKGINSAHYDFEWAGCTGPTCGLPRTGANIIRVGIWDFTATSQIQTAMNTIVNGRMVTEPGCYFTPSCSGGTTGSSSTTCLNECVSQWLNSYSTFKPYERNMILCLVSEWGPAHTCSGYSAPLIAAINTLRNAGYLATISIDSGNSGSDVWQVQNCASAILAGDPQHNLIFNYHAYGNCYRVGGDDTCPAPAQYSTNLWLDMNNLAAASAAGGFPVFIEEFGPGFNGTFTMSQLMQHGNELGMGWVAWAWDDSGQTGAALLTGAPIWTQDMTFIGSGPAAGQPANCTSPGPCTSQNCNCTADSDLSGYGNEVILSPGYGLFYGNYPKATVFP